MDTKAVVSLVVAVMVFSALAVPVISANSEVAITESNSSPNVYLNKYTGEPIIYEVTASATVELGGQEVFFFMQSENIATNVTPSVIYIFDTASNTSYQLAVGDTITIANSRIVGTGSISSLDVEIQGDLYYSSPRGNYGYYTAESAPIVTDGSVVRLFSYYPNMGMWEGELNSLTKVYAKSFSHITMSDTTAGTPSVTSEPVEGTESVRITAASVVFGSGETEETVQLRVLVPLEYVVTYDSTVSALVQVIPVFLVIGILVAGIGVMVGRRA